MFSGEETHEGMGGPLGQRCPHLRPHAVEEGEKESHEWVQDVGVVEVGGEEGNDEVEGGGEGGEEHLLGLEAFIG